MLFEGLGEFWILLDKPAAFGASAEGLHADDACAGKDIDKVNASEIATQNGKKGLTSSLWGWAEARIDLALDLAPTQFPGDDSHNIFFDRHDTLFDSLPGGSNSMGHCTQARRGAGDLASLLHALFAGGIQVFLGVNRNSQEFGPFSHRKVLKQESDFFMGTALGKH